MENVKSFMEKETSEVASEFPTYTFYAQAKLGEVMENCAADNEWSLEEKDFDSASFPYFANCVKNNVMFNAGLNSNVALKTLITGAQYH